MPSCFEFILGVTVESVQGSQVYLEWIGTSGSFGIVARNWSSSRVETGMSGNFLSCLKCVKDPFGAQEGRWDFSREDAAFKGLSSR